MRIMFAHISGEPTANVPDGPVKYPVKKDNPNYLFCNFTWFGIVSIRINKKK